MKNKLFKKQTLRYLIIILAITIFGMFTITFLAHANQPLTTSTANVEVVSQQILANGSTDAQNKATLNFQTGGKLIYLPFKEGDSVYQGQIIVSLDTYALQKQLQIVANSYQVAQNNNNQVQENQSTSVLEGQQRLNLDTTNKNSYSTVTEAQLISDNVQRIVANALLAKNSAQINVDLANYAMQLASLTSPINGIIMHQDVTSSGVNVTPATLFVVADPSSMVFSANVRQQDIDFISVGNNAIVTLDGSNGQSLKGIVDKIYPQKTTLATGEDVYKVDIKIDNLSKVAKFGQGGTVLIKSNFNQKVILVPSWAVLSNSNIWVLANGKPVLKSISVGKNLGAQTEIISGLSDEDKVITNPESIISNRYQIL